MHLLFFAHKPEAFSFITRGNTKKIFIQKNTFYKTKLYYLFITNTPVTLPSIDIRTLGITKVINLGIAAAISKKFKIDQVFKIGSYSYKNICDNEVVGNKLITLDKCYSNLDRSLDHFDFADQEAFHLKKWVQTQNLPFESHKIVSDFGENDLNFVKENAHRQSELLYQYYLKMLAN